MRAGDFDPSIVPYMATRLVGLDKAPCLRGRLLSMLIYFGSQIFLFRTLKAFSHVRRSVKQALYDIYRRDFELFGYNAEQYFL